MALQGEEYSGLPKLRPGLEKYTATDAYADQHDSAIGSLGTKEAEDGGQTEISSPLPQENPRSVTNLNSVEAEQRLPKLRRGLEKFDQAGNDSLRIDSAFGSLGVEDAPPESDIGDSATVSSLQNGNEQPVNFFAGRKSRTGPAMLQAVPSALSLAVRGAMDTLVIQQQAQTATETFVENTHCHNYACSGDERYLLAPYRSLLLQQNEDGDTTLHLAVINFQQNVVGQILAVLPNGTNIDVRNNIGQTPLQLAVITNQISLVKMFLQCGADACQVDCYGHTPVHIAAREGFQQCACVIVESQRGWQRDHLLAQRNFEGLTALHLAVLHSQPQLISALVSAGADVDDQDLTCGRSALHHAVETSQLTLASMLVFECKADLDAETYDGNVALHTAAGRNMVAMVGLLVSAGANRNVKNAEGDFPRDLTTNETILDLLHIEQ